MRVQFPATVVAFLMEGNSENVRVFEIWAHVKDLQVIKINWEPSTTAHLIACVALAR